MYVGFHERGVAVASVWSWMLRSKLRVTTLSCCQARLATESRAGAVIEQLFDIVPTLTFRHGERRRRPPRYRAMLARNTLPLLAECETVGALQALLEEVRKDLGFETLRVRVDDPSWRSALNGVGEVLVQETDPFRDPNLVEVSGLPSWSGLAKIFCQMRNTQRVPEFGMRNDSKNREPSTVKREDVTREDVKRELTTEKSRTCGEKPAIPACAASVAAGRRNPQSEIGHSPGRSEELVSPAGKSAIRNPKSEIGKAEGGDGGGSLDKSEIRIPKSEIAQWMVVGEVTATKPAWKRRRGSETDDELLQWLADGLGRWITAKRKHTGKLPPAPIRPQDSSVGNLEGQKIQRQES